MKFIENKLFFSSKKIFFTLNKNEEIKNNSIEKNKFSFSNFSKINVKILLEDQRIMRGTLIALDCYMNVILNDCKEFRHTWKQKKENKKIKNFSNTDLNIDKFKNIFKTSFQNFTENSINKEKKFHPSTILKNKMKKTTSHEDIFGWDSRVIGLCFIRGEKIISIGFD
jgi:small nuclear ribonucleoprotein (snRNP)-like protein